MKLDNLYIVNCLARRREVKQSLLNYYLRNEETFKHRGLLEEITIEKNTLAKEIEELDAQLIKLGVEVA